MLPLNFISSIWFPTDSLPAWLKDIAKVFPIRPLAAGLQYAFDPRTTGAGLNGADIEALADPVRGGNCADGSLPAHAPEDLT